MPLRPVRVIAAVALVLVGLGVPAWVAADGEASGIIVTPPIVRPGDEISVQGTFLWTELGVTAALVSEDGAARDVGTGATGPDGSLGMTAVVPTDLPAGRYTVRVTNEAGESVEGSVVVEPEAPWLPIVAISAAAFVLVLVGLSASRRRQSLA